jgi:hypothetical protein
LAASGAAKKLAVQAMAAAKMDLRVFIIFTPIIYKKLPNLVKLVKHPDIWIA